MVIVKWMVRITLLVASVVSMAWLMFGIQDVFPSPDERANALFAQTIATYGSLCVFEPLNVIAQGLVHPRSTVVLDDCILPTSFLGFPIVNAISFFVFSLWGKSVATFASFMMTPLLAVLALVAWWWTIRRLTDDERFADLAAFLVMVHPAWWYYGARAMMHNVPFVASLMIASAIFLRATDRRSRLGGVLAGVVFGVACSMRLVEAPLMLVLIAAFVFVCRQSIPWKALHRHPLLFFVVSASAVMAAYAVVSYAVYDSWFVTGYSVSETTQMIVGVSPTKSEPISIIDRVFSMLLPFGFHPRAMLRHGLQYGVQLYPLLSILSAIGMIFAFRMRHGYWRLSAVLLCCASLWMLVLYGSWSIADNVDPRAITVGNSYVRYWLPLFVASSVFGALALRTVMKKFRFGSVIVGVLCIILLITSARTVFGGTDGLLATRSALLTFQEKRESILRHVACDRGDDARPVIIVDRADKFLFPACRVIVPLRSDATYAILSVLRDVVPLYYYGITFPDRDVEYLNTVILPSHHLRIEHVETMEEESLYRFVRVE
jgi:hypothetical protein